MNGMPVTNNATDPLAELRDIHMPDPVSWWPPAPGWWLLFICTILLTGLVIWWWRKHDAARNQPLIVSYSRDQVLAAAMQELNRLEPATGVDDNTVVADLSALLRRIAMQLADEKEQQLVAGLSGEAWLNWLDSQWQQDSFCLGEGRLLLDAPYRPYSMQDSRRLYDITRQWLEAQR
ncbi:hypothetical protein MMIC_P1078 [Mariprofundus micogutta]|uniref:DUF4381 domain-containing protein n=1 Tax=Mariprofundus micogutta TaxID=1921010 RepID=A0A1L8CMJ1_9PROT|nr:DUF4381 domain-containing protein [Mariprofundus micogutta]GAV20116.1 hypothetical protein MMIC_P1078 [Mariprofundus micogutta]